MNHISDCFIRTVEWFLINCLDKKEDIDKWIVENKVGVEEKPITKFGSFILNRIDEVDEILPEVRLEIFYAELERAVLDRNKIMSIMHFATKNITDIEIMCSNIISHLKGFLSLLNMGELWVEKLEKQYEYILFVGREYKEDIKKQDK